MPEDQLQAPNDIVVYHYRGSPYASRIIWYLTLRRIAYAECRQAPILPRPDLKEKLNVSYRRIPVVAHRADIYLDSRHILNSLESLFPSSSPETGILPPLAPTTPTAQALLHLFSRYTTDAGMFKRAAALIPPNAGFLRDPKFRADRTDFSNDASWDPTARERARGEALVGIVDLFKLVEGLLADGRTWLAGNAGGEGPGLVDIEGAYIIDWLFTLKGAIPEEIVNSQLYPRTYAWRARFLEVVATRTKEMPKDSVVKMTGDQAAASVLYFSGHSDAVRVDAKDPLGLRAGEVVTVYPVDSGSAEQHRDTGTLVILNADEVVIEKEVSRGGEVKRIRVHTPRWGFRVVRAEAANAVAKL